MPLHPKLSNLANLKMKVCTGAAANSDITLTGITASDVIIGAVAINGPAAYAAPANVVTPTFQAADTIRTTTDTTGKTLLVFYVAM